MSKQIIRKAARTVIFDENNKVAILEVKNGDYHKIPGGGIENDENEELAAIREALEEGGCDVEIIKKIGEQEFVDPDGSNTIHHSVCFLAEKIKDHETSYFTEEEKKNKFRLLWLSVDKAIKLFKNVKTKMPFELAMNNRDLKFLEMAYKHKCK